ncbi:hypothetical protein BCD67_01135 [Oscillatoriales cyanobacterium USR001]|nr:hypothetical protein BCD67_01135 [Oscillatoriales cyanobacterium USR001]
MSNISIFPISPTTNWQCPECDGTGSIDEEICPVCFGATLIDSSAAAEWLINFMQSSGGPTLEIEELRKEAPDPLILAVCLGVCSAIKRT